MPCLGPLPPAPVPEYANYQSRVRRWCTIQVAGHSYSVPSRLIGKEVQIRLYADWVEVYYKGSTWWNAWSGSHGDGEANVNYRHVIGYPWCASREPSPATCFREQLFPTMHFRLKPTTRCGPVALRSVPTWSTCGSCSLSFRAPWKPRWTARCRYCWRRVSPST